MDDSDFQKSRIPIKIAVAVRVAMRSPEPDTIFATAFN
jgi:hypothetical protein